MARSETKQLTLTLDELIEIPGRDYLEEIVLEDLEWDQGVEDIDFIDYNVVSIDTEENSVTMEIEVYFFDTSDVDEDLDDDLDSYSEEDQYEDEDD